MHLLAVVVGLGAPAFMSDWFLNIITSSSLGVGPKDVSGSFAASLMSASRSMFDMGVSGSGSVDTFLWNSARCSSALELSPFPVIVANGFLSFIGPIGFVKWSAGLTFVSIRLIIRSPERWKSLK
jgi:hypothetical protein